MKNKLYASIRIIKADNYDNAKKNVQDGIFVDNHLFSDIIVELDNLRINYPVKYKL